MSDQQSPANSALPSFGEANERTYDEMGKLSAAERSHIAMWVALMHPDVAEQAMAALVKYKEQYPDAARRAGMPVGPEEEAARDAENARAREVLDRIRARSRDGAR